MVIKSRLVNRQIMGTAHVVNCSHYKPSSLALGYCALCFDEALLVDDIFVLLQKINRSTTLLLTL